MRHVRSFRADLGGTEIILPFEAVLKKRYTDMNLEVFLLTDGDIWNQQGLFDVVNREVQASDGTIRLFSLGVGRSMSHGLVEGLARSGRGFAQTVGENDNMDRKVVRVLKSALTPHSSNYTISVKYAEGEVSTLDGDGGFDLVDAVVAAGAAPGSVVNMTQGQTREQEDVEKDLICLFDPDANPDDSYLDWHLIALPRRLHLFQMSPATQMQSRRHRAPRSMISSSYRPSSVLGP